MAQVEAPRGDLEANAAALEPGHRVEELLPSVETLPDLTLIVSSYEDLLSKEQEQVKALLLQMPNCEDTDDKRLLPIESYKAGNRVSLLYLAKEGDSIVGMMHASLRDSFGSLDAKEQGSGVISLSNAITKEGKRNQKIMTRLIRGAFNRLDDDIRKKFEIDVAAKGEEILTDGDKQDGITLDMIGEQLQHPALVVTTTENTADYKDKHGMPKERVGQQLRRIFVEAALDNGWISDPTVDLLKQMAAQKEVAEIDLVGTDDVSLSFLFQFDNAEYNYDIELHDGTVVFLPVLRSGRIAYEYETPKPTNTQDETEIKAKMAEAVRTKYAELESAFQNTAGDKLRRDNDEGFQAAYWVNRGDLAKTQQLKTLVDGKTEFKKDDSEPPQIRVHFLKPSSTKEESSP